MNILLRNMVISSLLLGSILCGCIPAGSSDMGLYSSGNFSSATGSDSGQAKYTVNLKSFTGPQHAQYAKYTKTRLESVLGWDDLFVVSSSGGSDLYWGVFNSAADAESTLRKARQHETTGENKFHPFALAKVTAMPGSNQSLAQYDLLNSDAYYTLLVASFEDLPEASPPYVGRMGFAEKYCTQLREQGYEAWFYHGPVISNVTVGSFGAQAVRHTQKRVASGNGDTILVEKKEVVSQELLNLQKQFPNLIYNGVTFYEVKRDANGNVISRSDTPAETYAVKVPEKK